MKFVVALLLLCVSCNLFAYTEHEVVTAVLLKEAGGEGDEGLKAVASVIQTRAKKRKFPFLKL